MDQYFFFFFCRSFSNFQYFDSKGMFISLVYSIPLLVNTIIIVVGAIIQHQRQIKSDVKSTTEHCFSLFVVFLCKMVWVHRTFSTMAELKTLQLQRKSQAEKRKNN